MTPLISIIIPTYNHAKFLPIALQSIVDQKYKNWEAIVINNNSTDNTVELVKKFQDSRINIWNTNNNGIIAVSRNKGIELAKGEWVALLDSDDCWESNKLEVIVDAIIKNKNIDLIYHRLYIKSEGRTSFFRKKIKSWKLTKKPLIDLILNGNPIANSSAVFRKKVWHEMGGFSIDPEIVGSEDYNAWLKMAVMNKNFLYVRKCLGTYLIHSNGMSRGSPIRSLRAATKNFRNYLTKEQEVNFEGLINYVEGKYFYQQGNLNDCIVKLKKSFCLSNSRIRILITLFFGIIFLNTLLAKIKNK